MSPSPARSGQPHPGPGPPDGAFRPHGVRHRDDALVGSSVTTPVLAALAVVVGVGFASRGGSVLVASSVGLASYVAMAAACAAIVEATVAIALVPPATPS
jgi:hypothetical protein